MRLRRNAIGPLERPDMHDLIPDDDTLATLSAMAMLADRGETMTLDALEAELRRHPPFLPGRQASCQCDGGGGTK